MATPAYMSITGTKQGLITAGAFTEGQRVHKPVVITKVFDKASPLLLAALTSGERLTKVEIQWYRTSAAGTQEHYYTKITWTHEVSGTSGSDDWRSPVAG
ncbi:type VI secretion system tube protein TssD [Pseudomonas aeruginosa]|uniref:type VI secretion system tube protein TssD n=1 Tax=Pseudomonas aeruginosa TaxID=287 RepID=UPI003BF5544F